MWYGGGVSVPQPAQRLPDGRLALWGAIRDGRSYAWILRDGGATAGWYLDGGTIIPATPDMIGAVEAGYFYLQ